MVYYPIKKCRSFWTWLCFPRIVCGRVVLRVCGFDNYGSWKGGR